MKSKFLLSFITVSALMLFNLNAFAWKYAAKVKIDNNTDQDLILALTGDNNINNTIPFVSEDTANPDKPSTESIKYISARSQKVFYADNFDWTILLNQEKKTNYLLFRKNFEAEPTFITKGTISVYTSGLVGWMYAYFDTQLPLVKAINYKVVTTPDWNNSVAGSPGNSADLTINISTVK